MLLIQIEIFLMTLFEKGFASMHPSLCVRLYQLSPALGNIYINLFCIDEWMFRFMSMFYFFYMLFIFFDLFNNFDNERIL